MSDKMGGQQWGQLAGTALDVAGTFFGIPPTGIGRSIGSTVGGAVDGGGGGGGDQGGPVFGDPGMPGGGPSGPGLPPGVTPGGKGMPGGDMLKNIPWQQILKMANPSVKMGPGAPQTPPNLATPQLSPMQPGPTMQPTAPAALAKLAELGPHLGGGGGGGQNAPMLALLRMLGGGR